MGYNNDWIWDNKFFKSVMVIMGFLYWYVFILFVLVILTAIISICFGDTRLLDIFQEHTELCTFITSVVVLVIIMVKSSIKDRYKMWKLTDEDKDLLAHFHFGKMTRKQKKLMAMSIRISSRQVFLRLSRMNLLEAIKDYRHSDFNLNEQSSRNVDLLLKAIPNMDYIDKGVTHSLSEWEAIFAEERIKFLKEKIRSEWHRIHKYRGKSNDAKQADLLNISYLDYKRYTTFYNGILNAAEKFGLNSPEVKLSIRFAIDRIVDLQEWFDFVDSKKHLPLINSTDNRRYATFKTNIISNASNIANIFYTKGSFYVMAYFDNITYEERDTFNSNDVTLYLYYYDLVYFLIFEFAKLRFAVPINIKDIQVDFDKWVNSNTDTILVNLVEKSDGRIATSRTLHLKRMMIIKEKLKKQKLFVKDTMDIAIKQVLQKSIDELVYNGCIFEVIKGDKNMKEGYLFYKKKE